MALSLQIGWRFLRQRNHNGFVSFISFSSVVGVAVGVMVLILVLSAMNGFERELRDRLLAVVPHAEFYAPYEPIQDWPSIAEDATNTPGIIAAAPFVLLEGLLQRGDTMKSVSIRGVLPDHEALVSDAPQFIDNGSWQSLADNGNHLILGKGLARQLGLKLGDRVNFLLPRTGVNAFSAPRTVPLILTGVFDLGGEIDGTLALINLDYAAELAGLGNGVNGIRFKVDDLFAAPQLVQEIGYRQNHYLYLSDWTRTQGHLYSDIQLVRTLTYLVLLLVVAVASFNIICSLVMSVRDKEGEIAILRTMGMARRQILSIFLVQGAMTGGLGCLIGALIGSLLALQLSNIVEIIERWMGKSLLSGDIYFIDFLPSELQGADVALVSLLAFVVTVVASLYPAWQASRMAPVEALSR